ncbi:unnamed protein product [Larinioides sclopetarius]|uniref:Angiogenic factor with G patch and FHA domains 1 n=1 Tax=Larinioides sclopetarius TaxID=280406 RepID=A0AAV1Z2C0_9ARAC
MSDCEINCDKCKTLTNVLNQKEEEIKKLKLQIQNLNEVLDNYRIQSKRCRLCCNSKQCTNDNSSSIKTEGKSTNPEDVHSNQKCLTQNSDEKLNLSNPFCTEISNLDNSSTDSSAACQTNEDGNNPSVSKELYENLNHNDDYIYDEQSKMYYSVSTGFYYDTNTELFYVPQTGSYYKYDYSKHKYELYKKTEESCDSNVHDACDSVADKVDNLNINDCESFSNNSEQLSEEKSNYCSQSQNSPVQKHYTININLTSEIIQPESRNANTEVSADSSIDWLPPEGSNTTVKDLVTEVAEQNSGMSDYIYDEKCSMYYCRSNGNYYDPIRKLLYDPRARIYYLYIQETLSYEFYCKADAISDESNQEISTESKEPPQKEVSKAEARKRFWKRKQKISTKQDEILPRDNKEDSLQEDERTVNEGFSSPEAGEIFSSDSEPELMNDNPVSPAKEESSPPCPPCIRAIVEHSSKLKIGSLILITCTGAVIGRESSNTVKVPEIGVSKVHAEITFDNESWKYSIEDLGSQNGTFVNEVRLSEPKQKSKPQVLSHGDKLALGSCKLLIHIHDGYETCDQCEPGQVIAELSSKEVKVAPVLKTKKEKEKERRQEMKRLKKKYGLQGMEYCDGKNCVPPVSSGYEDKAEIRRKTVGSQNPYEKTEVASMDVSMSEFNKGYQMLKKLGWKEGDSLGLKNSGISDPIPIRPWLSKAGLGSTEAASSREPLPEDRRKRKWVKAQERYFQLSS